MVAAGRIALGHAGDNGVVIEILVGVIADTATPGRVDRLLRDMGDVAALAQGCDVRVIVLDNPSAASDPARVDAMLDEHRRAGLRVERITQDGGQGRLPIASARTVVQRACVQRAQDPGKACAWILDEDLRLLPLLEHLRQGMSLADELTRMRRAGCDVLLSPILGAPPLPARSTVRVNLEDVHRHLLEMAQMSPETLWPDRRAENVRVRQHLAEYYYDHSCAHGDAAEWPMWLEPAHPQERVRDALLRLCSAAGGLRHGQPVTRDIRIDGGAHPPLPMSRGGNTLVLNLELLARFPNPEVSICGRVARRSDMLWARLATAHGGARFGHGRMVATQDRSGPGQSEFSVDKLLDDIRGSALVKAAETLLMGRAAPADALAAYLSHRRLRIEQVQRAERLVKARLLALTGWLQRALAQSCVWFSGEKPARAAVQALAQELESLASEYQAPLASPDGADEQELHDVRRFILMVQPPMVWMESNS